MAKFLKTYINKDIKDEKLNDYSVNEIECEIKNVVEKFLQRRFEENCTVRYFKTLFITLKLRKKYLSYAKGFIGMDEKNICVFFYSRPCF